MYEKFEKLLTDRNVTAYRVAKDLGMPRSAFTGWKNGRSTPKAETLQKIAEYFKIPLSYFYDELLTEQSYYIDPEVAEIAQELHDDPEMRGLFKAARNLSKEDIIKFKEIIEGYERGK